MLIKALSEEFLTKTFRKSCLLYKSYSTSTDFHKNNQTNKVMRHIRNIIRNCSEQTCSIVKNIKTKVSMRLFESENQSDLKIFKKFEMRRKSDDSKNIGQFFVFGTIGEGSFGRVVLSLSKDDKKIYAIKILDKAKIIKNNQLKHVVREKDILFACDHPNIIKLHFCFKDSKSLYLVFDFLSNGDLYNLIKVKKNLTEDETKFYATNIFLALEYLHSNDIIYRDLKPENCLLASNGYIKLIDFGFAKHVKTTTNTYCGTPDYLAPE